MRQPTTPYSLKKRDQLFKVLFYALVVIGVSVYWIYMMQLEQYYPSDQEELNTVMLLIVRMFNLSVLRHLVPLIAGWWLARSAALTLTELLYDLPDRHAARTYLLHRHTFYDKGKPINVTQANLDELRLEHALIRVGGPGLVQINGGEVAITERNGDVLNIYEAGIHELGMLERIHSILDLKPLTATLPNLNAYTCEYLPITADITLRFRIDTGEADGNDDNPYPVNKVAVRNIVYGRNVKKDGTLSDWDARAKFAVRFNFQKVIRKYTLSDIMFTKDVYADIHKELAPLVEKQLNGAGFNFISIRVTSITPKNSAAFKQYIKLWRAKQAIELESKEALDKAVHEMEVQANKSDAEARMLKAIVEGVDKARQEGAVIDVKTAVSLRLIQAMEGIIANATERQPEAASPEAAANLTLLTQIQSQLRE